MKLYYAKGACSFSVRIVIHEIGLFCEFEAVNLQTKKTEKGADYLKINPKGPVPALVLDTQEVLTENTAIHQYLADKHHAHQLLPPVGEFKRYRVLEWLSYINSDLHKSCGPLFNPNVPQEMKENLFRPILKNKLAYIEQSLQQNKYLLGETFVLADAYLFVILSWLPRLEIDIAAYPHLTHYFAELKKRKSVQQALKEEGIDV